MHHNFTWTIERVKAELPAIEVLVGERKYTARLRRGRIDEFAAVQVSAPDRIADYHASWQTVANCLNNDCALRI